MEEKTMSEIGSNENNQYLTFMLDEEVFGVAIDKVREVLDFTSVTRVPQTPAYMRGVINLRGSVLPVIDLRLKFRMSKTVKTVNTCIIIVEIEMDGEKTVLGALADSVKEVLDIESNDIEPPPQIGTKLNIEFIRGLGKHNEEFIIILDIDKVFSAEEMTSVQGTYDENLDAPSDI